MEGDTGSIPSLETKIPQAVGHLSSHTTTTEPYSPRAQALQQEKPPQWEACALKPEKAHKRQWGADTPVNKHTSK